ncbi:RagB/SusD family nutrient uptake outer membrane protein [Sphingobacterium thermophilum]|uniref:RagB/SusD family nutrient uptake outer membrane protein n=1 Tax=Sphingobacterium thermophilum TaxID=768534 RepID=A0ABP8R1B4_9SPHI
MKKFNILLATALLSTASFVGCEKQVFEEPYSSLSPADVFSTPERIDKAAVGMYDALQNAEWFGGRVLIYADIRGIDCGVPSYFGDLPRFNDLTSRNGTVSSAWTAAYRTINEANLFLKNLAANPGVAKPENEKKYVAEAKFIRALNYFYAVNLWAQPYKFTPDASHLGVPLVLTASDAPFAPENQVARNTVKEVYDQIIKDLTEAAQDLPVAPETRSINSVGRATQGAAQALLARVYLYMQDYNKALEYANKVIASNKYALNETPEVTFREYTTLESIFSVAHNGGDNPNTNNALGQHYAPEKRADIAISPEYVNLMEATDLRRKNLIVEDDQLFYTRKYTGVQDWAPVLRYSEVLLIKAEALANLASSVSQEALDLVNTVRERSNATPVTATSKAELIEKILTERRIELAFEGHGIFEFLRTGRNIPAHATVNEQPFGSDYVVLPIPFTDIQRNPNLQQNKGY